MLTEHKEICLNINGAQSVRFEKRKIEFKKYFKQMPVPFKIYAGFECNLKSVESFEDLYSKTYQDHIPCSFAYKFVCVDDKFTKPIVVFSSEKLLMNLLKQFLKSMDTVKSNGKTFSFSKTWKNLVMSEEKVQFQSSNTCWICEKLIGNDDGKVRDHCHITGKFRGAAHWRCYINLQLTKKVSVIFHNLRGYDSHLIFCELKNFDVKIDVIPNRLEKYMALF